MKPVLIITYYWPPGSGAGVQRWLKFAKYLPGTGWEPVILTVDPKYATYPAIDNSLPGEIPEGIKVFRTEATDYFRLYRKDKSKIPSAGFASNGDKSLIGTVTRFIRGNFFIPDPRKGWNRYAFREACKIILNENINHVITTSPPHSTQLIGLRLKKKFPGLKWIADLRDPWTDIYYYNQFHPALPARLLDSHYERKVLRSADRIITVGKTLSGIFSAKMPGTSDRMVIIPNGYDEEDFVVMTASDSPVFTLSYTGTLSDSYPVEGLLKSLSELKQNNHSFRLRFIGMVAGDHKETIIASAGRNNVEFIPYVGHKRAIQYMLNSSVLLLIIPDHHSNKSIITGKLFEYIATGRPVLCLAPPNGDAAAILEETGHGKAFDYDDVVGITGFLTERISGIELKEKISPLKYSRRKLTNNIAAVLDDV